MPGMPWLTVFGLHVFKIIRVAVGLRFAVLRKFSAGIMVQFAWK